MPRNAELRPARTLREDELVELAQSLRKELDLRGGERLAKEWALEAASDLREGRLSGWGRPVGPEGVGELGFYSRRGTRAFGHVHVSPGPDGPARALELLERMATDPELGGLPLSVGVTGLSADAERALAETWSDGGRRSTILREGLERGLDATHVPPAEPVPPGLVAVAVARVTAAALAELDWRGFRGSLDGRLFANDPAENRAMVDYLLAGGLGPFLPEASLALLDESGRLAAALLSVELSPRIALIADLVVDPALRRRGLGAHLLRGSFRALRALGYDSVRLWVTEGNDAARRLYERLGFERYETARLFLQSEAEPLPQPQAAR